MNLNQVTAPCTDLEASIRFYRDLGLELIVAGNGHYARFLCPDGHSTFSLQLTDSLPSAPGVHVYFECRDLDQTVKELLEKGFRFTELPNDKPWLWREARLSDPSGNVLILYFAGENRVNPPWRLASKNGSEG